MATKNFAANLKIGAALSSSVGRVFGGLKTKIKDQEATLKKLRAAYKEASKGTGEFAGSLDKLEREIAQAEAKLKRFKAAAKFDIGAGFRGVGSTFASDVKRLAVGAGALTAAVVATGTAVYSVTKGFVDWADDIGDSAEALGMSTQALQTWQFAAATVGVGGSKMTASIAKFSKAIMEGGDATDEALGKLTINAKRLRKLGLDEQLEVVAEAFKNYKGADKAALSMKLFGKSGYQLAGILSKGKKGLDEFRKAGEETGAVLDDEAAEAAGRAASALDMFGITMIGLRNTIAIQFVPTLQKLTERFTAFIRTNGPQIKQWARDFADLIETRVVPALGKFIEKLPGIIDKLSTFASKAWGITVAVKNWLGGWDNLGIAVVALNFAPTIAAITSMAASMWTLTGATWAAVGPWAALAAAVGAVFWIMTNQEKVGSWFESQMGEDNFLALGEGLLLFKDDFDNFLSDITSKVTKWFNDGVEDSNRFRAKIGEVWTSMKNGANEAVESITNAFKGFFDWVLGKFDALGKKAAELWGSIKNIFTWGGGDDGSTSQVAPKIMSPEKMSDYNPARGTANNTWNINVNAPGADGKRIADQIRTEFQRKPLFDSDTALVPA